MSTTSLSEKVAALLARANPTLANAFEVGFSRSRSGRDDMVDLNKYLRLQLCKVPVSTLDERECWVDDLDEGMWIKYFEIHVLPTMIRFNLPKE